MASGNIAKARTEEPADGTLMKIAGKAAEDLISQVGRLGPNIKLARNFGQTTLANGVVDDRKYLVSTREKTTSVRVQNAEDTSGSTRESFSWQHRSPMTPVYETT